MDIQKKITLTDDGINSGPGYAVYGSTDCNTFFFVENVVLPTIGSSVVVTFPESTMCIKLVSLGICSNGVTHVVPGALQGDFSFDFNLLDFE